MSGLTSVVGWVVGALRRPRPAGRRAGVVHRTLGCRHRHRRVQKDLAGT